jgi:hypothetical protein
MVVLRAVGRVFRLLETVAVRRLFQEGLRFLNHRDLTLTVARWRGHLLRLYLFILHTLSLYRKLILLVTRLPLLTLN